MRGAEDESLEDCARDGRRAAATRGLSGAFARFGYCEGFGGGARRGCGGKGRVKAKVGKVGEGGFVGGECCHAPLGEPALEGYVAGVVADGAGWKTVLEPLGWETRGRSEEGGEFGGGEAAVVILVMEEEEIDEEAVANRRELGGGVGGNIKLWIKEAGVQGEAVGIVECAEDQPDSLMTPPFSKKFVKLDEAWLGDTLFGRIIRRVFLDGRFDSRKIEITKRLSKALDLEILDLLIAKESILISIA